MYGAGDDGNGSTPAPGLEMIELNAPVKDVAVRAHNDVTVSDL